MSDISTVWVADAVTGDWQVLGAQLVAGDDLSGAVLRSLFTDRAANPDDVIPDGTEDPRGWWSDPTLGSRLWLLQRAKQTDETLQRARDYIAEALQWLIDRQVASKIEILTEWSRPGMLGSQITIYRTDGAATALRFAWAWQQLRDS